jgi:hypothetical protein
VDIGDEGYIICESPEQSSRCDASSNQSALRGALRMSECLLRSPVPRNVDLSERIASYFRRRRQPQSEPEWKRSNPAKISAACDPLCGSSLLLQHRADRRPVGRVGVDSTDNLSLKVKQAERLTNARTIRISQCLSAHRMFSCARHPSVSSPFFTGNANVCARRHW